MHWLKKNLVDLSVTVTILLFAWAKAQWLEIPLLVYSCLLLMMKCAGLLNRELLRQLNKRAAPAGDWLYHALYALNLATLAASQHRSLSLLWAGIWLVSWLTSRKMRSLPQASRSRK